MQIVAGWLTLQKFVYLLSKKSKSRKEKDIHSIGTVNNVYDNYVFSVDANAQQG